MSERESEKRDWALLFWMMGVSVAHGLRFVVFDDPTGRQVVAAGGVLVYGLAAAAAVLNHRWSLKLSRLVVVLFPLVGITTVLATGAKIDDWQLAVGVTQFSAVVYVLRHWLVERVL